MPSARRKSRKSQPEARKQQRLPPPGKTLCLNMIVKNEMANLERCLTAVAPWITCWVIGDTGSTDGTQEYIEAFFAERGIPGELHSFPFENFAQARNEALNRARASKLEYDYLLFADADMEWTVQEPTFAESLTAAAYLVVQRSTALSYWNNRLLRRDVPAEYRAVTHEYLDVRGGETLNLKGVSFIDHATGSNRVEKYERDARLLREALATETDPGLVARYNFYLANTLRDAGEREAAIDAYRRRVGLGFWQQEVFISLYNIGRLKEALEHPDEEVIAAYVEATAACPTRAEALHAAARFCRSHERHERGYQFAAEGLRVAYPTDGLFVEDWIYNYGLLDELAINAYWTGRYRESAEVCDRLLAEGNLPLTDQIRVRKNRVFAIEKLEQGAGERPPPGSYRDLLGQAREKERLEAPDDQVIQAYEAAAAADPHQAEALYWGARYCRIKGLNDRGADFASRGLAVPRPGDAADAWIYDWGLHEELSIVANYSRDPNVADRGFAACNWLALNRGIPDNPRNLALSNLRFYMKSAVEMLPSFSSRRIEFTPPTGYHATNPSIIRRGDGFLVVQRAVNYVINPAFPDGDPRRYETPNDEYINTRNFLLDLDDDLSIRSSKEILRPSDMPEPAWLMAQGFEDMRPFVWRDQLWSISCVRELSSEGWCDQVLARVDESSPDEAAKLVDWGPLHPPGERLHEKNWMPQVVGDDLRFVYLCDPSRVVDEQAQTVTEATPAIDARMFRGGSQVVDFDGGWLVIIHETRVLTGGQREYRHRFVWFDADMRLRRLSRPFFLHSQGVEFAAGLAWRPGQDSFVLTYGIGDSEAWIATVSAADVRSILEDAEALPSGAEIVRGVQATAARRRQTQPAAQSQLHFIVGVPRSGTTLFRAMLGAHASIFAPSETPWLMGAYGGDESLRGVLRRLTDSDDGPLKKMHGVAAADVSRAAERFVCELFDRRMQELGKDLLVLKTPDDIWFVDDLLEFFPRSKILHVRRDVRDVALSTVATDYPQLNHFGANNFENAVLRWLEWEARVLELVDSGAENIHSFRFEDLLLNPTDELRRAAGVLGVPFDPSMLDYAPRFIDAPVNETGVRDVLRQPSINAARAHAYRAVAPSPSQLAAIEARGARIEALGYPSGWPREPKTSEESSALQFRPEGGAAPVREKISAFVVTYNRESIVEVCLRSLRFADELIVVDKSSDDGTLDIARRYADRVVVVPWTPTADDTREYALSLCSHDLIVYLDDDECLSPAAIEFILSEAAQPSAEVYSLPRHNYFLGRFDPNTRDWPDYKERFFRRGAVEFKPVIHGCIDVTSESRRVVADDSPAFIHHLHCATVSDWVEKTNRYTSQAQRESWFATSAELSPAFVRQQTDYWFGGREAEADPHLASYALAHVAYDLVDRVKRWEQDSQIDGRAAFVGLCRALHAEYDALGEACRPRNGPLVTPEQRRWRPGFFAARRDPGRPDTGGKPPASTRDVFLELAQFLDAVDSPSKRREASRAFDFEVLASLDQDSADALPHINCFYEVMSESSSHASLIAATRSMRAVGHPVRVWSYTPAKLEFLKEHGVELCDAADVVPKEVFERVLARSEIRYVSDVFRYAVLYERGGLWMDTDVVMLRPFRFQGDYFFNLQWRDGGKGHFVCGNVIYAKPYSPHMRALYAQSLDKSFGEEGWEFGDVGPKLLSDYIASDRGAPLRQWVFSPVLFNTIDWTEIGLFERPLAELGELLNDDRVVGIHLWNAKTNVSSREDDRSLITILSDPVGRLPGLATLADRFDTDKNRHTGNRHGYARIYERLLGERRFAMRRLMEINRREGPRSADRLPPSVALWQAYFPFCHVVELDLHDVAGLNDRRFTSIACDQSRVADLQAAAANLELGSFDVLVDDGSHASIDQQLTLMELWPLLKGGGWYFIEDLDWQPPGEDPSRTPLTKDILGEMQGGQRPALDPLGLNRLAGQIHEILFFDSHYELGRAGLKGGLVAIRKRGGSAR